ncbi:HD domain-containing phosphohydrolase [Nitrincola iocasae]|uniref:HD domain-containing protein n=1 Tax=Nitrincola iocasae TaxID=2614693 RepID=A0A5J6LA39_9GAMM|nr:HD domain-containing phosphohydrolase [Nitrincola iocasae]QEW05365.1 HD domain-containing protein [Nitrincola iocasae]
MPQPPQSLHPHSGLRLPLSIKFLLFAIAILILNGFLLSQQTDQVIEKAFLDQADQKIQLLLDQIRRNIEHEHIELSDDSLAEEVDYLNQHPDFGWQLHVTALYVFDAEGIILAHSQYKDGAKTLEPGSAYHQVIHLREASLGETHERKPATNTVKGDYLLPMTIHDGRIAGIEAEVDITGLQEAISSFDGPFEQSMWNTILLSSAVMLILLGGLTHFWLTGPVQRMHRAILDLSDGKLDTRIDTHSKDELGQLANGINQLAQNVQDLLREQERTYMAALTSLAQALQAKDPYTAAHSGRVSHYAVKLGKVLGLNKEELALLKKGALMHDLGKIGIHDTILNKPSALTDAEYEDMKKHPTITATIMKPLKRFRAFAEIAAWHHERWDGTGYPDGLKGDETPLLARIVAIADTWDAMTGDRVYRPGMPKEKALNILEAEQDQGQFDPELIRIFIQMMKQDDQGVSQLDL